MAKLAIQVASTSQTVNIFIQDSSSTTGAGLTGLVFNTSSLVAYYALPKAAAVSITLATLAAVTSAYSSGGFKEIDATNMPGWYRFDIPDAAIASGRFVSIHLKGATNMAPLPLEVELTGWNNQDAVRGGMTALPNANAEAAGGLYTRGTGAGQINQNNNGSIDTNVVRINAVVTTSVTTVNANLGMTQPINFTGTGASALAKSDMVDIAGAAVSTSTAQIGTNAVQLGGTVQTGRDIGASVLLSSGTGTGQIDFTSGVVKANLAQILGTALTETAGLLAAGFKKFFNVATPTGTLNSIPDAVAGAAGGLLIAGSNAATTVNITGNITGNVSGSVGSVTARVTANTDQLAGQTVTAAAGVTFPTSVASPTNITAGTITTTTNLTNAPTAGDFTAVMKTSLNAATPVVTLAAAAIQAIWDALTSALTISGSIGKLLVDNITGNAFTRLGAPVGASISADIAAVKAQTVVINADTDDIQTRLPAALVGGRMDSSVGAMAANVLTASSLATDAVNEISDQVWDEVLSGHTTPGTTGAALSAAGSAGDPWATPLPGAYGAGTAGKIVGDNINATVSSRAVPGDAMALTSGERATLAGVVWANATRTLTGFGTLVADTATAVWAFGSRTLTTFGFTVTTDVSSIVTTNLDATVSSRLASASYTAAPTAVQNADALLGRNIGGGLNGGRTVTSALQPLRNKVTSAAGVLTVYDQTDGFVSWTSVLTTDPAAEPIVSSDPA